MAGDLRSGSTDPERSRQPDPPAVSVCSSRPGTFVFIEAGNTDGWIATDVAVEPSR